LDIADVLYYLINDVLIKNFVEIAMPKIILNSFLWLFLFSWSTVSGCATSSSNTAQDPFEGFNRSIFAFNEGVDKVILKPVAKGYKAIMPEPLNQGVTNFFSNLDDVVVIANDLLQFKLTQAASDTGRIVLNSTVGLLGFFDVASQVGLTKHDEDFGQTLGYWGIGNGPYIVLPLFGPSSARDAFGFGTDTFLDPLYYYAGSKNGIKTVAPYAAKAVDERSDLLAAEKVLNTAALDKYAYLRDAYLARREYLVYDGNPPEDEEDDDIFDEDDEDDEDQSEDQDQDVIEENEDRQAGE
jgi:phospholipid-binding lipoprotein MlaA